MLYSTVVLTVSGSSEDLERYVRSVEDPTVRWSWAATCPEWNVDEAYLVRLDDGVAVWELGLGGNWSTPGSQMAERWPTLFFVCAYDIDEYTGVEVWRGSQRIFSEVEKGGWAQAYLEARGGEDVPRLSASFLAQMMKR